MKFIKTIRHGETRPKFYGFAWARADMDAVVVVPIPLNVIARWIWRFHMLVAVGRVHQDADRREEYMRGFHDGQFDALRRVNK